MLAVAEFDLFTWLAARGQASLAELCAAFRFHSSGNRRSHSIAKASGSTFNHEASASQPRSRALARVRPSVWQPG